MIEARRPRKSSEGFASSGYQPARWCADRQASPDSLLRSSLLCQFAGLRCWARFCPTRICPERRQLHVRISGAFSAPVLIRRDGAGRVLIRASRVRPDSAASLATPSRLASTPHRLPSTPLPARTRVPFRRPSGRVLRPFGAVWAEPPAWPGPKRLLLPPDPTCAPPEESARNRSVFVRRHPDRSKRSLSLHAARPSAHPRGSVGRVSSEHFQSSGGPLNSLSLLWSPSYWTTSTLPGPRIRRAPAPESVRALPARRLDLWD